MTDEHAMGNPAGDGPLLRSEPSQSHSFVRFCNRTLRRADVIWFNYAGQGVKYKTLLPTQTIDVNTFVGHPWMFRDHDTGDRLVVQMEEVFKPEGYVQPMISWPPNRRSVYITVPVLSLYEACLIRVRNLTRHHSVTSLQQLEEHLPTHIVEELIHQHKLAAIYFRMARGVYYGSSSTSVADDVRNTPHVGDLNAYGSGSGSGSRSSASSSGQSGSSSSGSSSSSDPNDGACASTSSSTSSGASASAAAVAASSWNSDNVPPNGNCRLSINARHAQTSRTLGLLSPCTVTTHPLPPGASNSPSSPSQGGNNGIQGTGAGLLSVQEHFFASGMLNVDANSRDSLLEYEDDDVVNIRDDDDDVDDDDSDSSCSSDSDDNDDEEEKEEEEKGSSDINDSGLGNGETADNNNEPKCSEESSATVRGGGVLEEGGGVLVGGGATLE